MREITQIPSPDSQLLADLYGSIDSTHVTAGRFRYCTPDSVFTDSRGAVCVWSTNAPSIDDHVIGVIGCFAADNGDTAVNLLNEASRFLGDSGCTLAIGPMDANTWNRYRAMTQRGERPAFFLEPQNPVEWATCFTDAGFKSIAEYTSALVDDLTRKDPRLEKAIKRLSDSGITIRHLDADRFEHELAAIHQLSLECFAGNFLYSPISAEEFAHQYTLIQPMVRPELVLIAEDHSGPVGFMFAIPDALQGDSIDTVILKTVARLSKRVYSGLGNVLVERCHTIAHELGYKHVIHALMHETNTSISLSSRYGNPFRRYALFGKALV